MQFGLDRAVRSRLALQVGGVVAAFLLLAALPPSEGRMLILPLSARATAGLPALVVNGGARIMGAGPIQGSLVVWARRDALFGAVAHHGALLVAAPPAACGESEAPAP